jgi:hypothetical protein
MDLTDVYRVFYPATAQYTFFSAIYGTFQKMDHIFSHKASCNIYKKVEVTSCLLSYHNTIKLELIKTRKSKKHFNTWKLKSTLFHG